MNFSFFSLGKIIIFLALFLTVDLQSKVTLKSIYSNDSECITLISIAMEKNRVNGHLATYKKLEKLKIKLLSKKDNKRLDNEKKRFLIKHYERKIKDYGQSYFYKRLSQCEIR